MNEEEFQLSLPIVPKGRKSGVSGIMRVKNDAEFIEASIDSCINSLDELIIVYNDCQDNSPDLIEKKKKEYPNKIKVYAYTPSIYAFNLTKEMFDKTCNLPHNSVHLLSNYYNYALSKISYRFFMKIDADQIYNSDVLKDICEAYRAPESEIRNSWLEKLVLFIVSFSFRVCDRYSFYFPIILSKKRIRIYYQALLKKIKKEKVSVSLSGINLLWKDKAWEVTLGKKSKINILPPFNGNGDHLILELKNTVYYEPYVCRDYSKTISQSYSIIERLAGSTRSYPIGFIWCHLNANRLHIHTKQLEECEDRFSMDYDAFVKQRRIRINEHEVSQFMAKRNIVYFKLLYRFFSLKINASKYMDNYFIDNNGFLKNKKTV